MARLCILTPQPDYPENWAPMADQFRALFADNLAFRCWTDAHDLHRFDLVLPLLAWGYQREPARWYAALEAWAAAALPFANALPLLGWNTDKRYLLELAEKGIAIVPSRLSTSLAEPDIVAARAAFAGADLVIKPTISGGADGTYILRAGDDVPADVRGQAMLIQPMMPAILTEGEYSLFYFGGSFSHAILKVPARGDFRVQEQFGGRETVVAAPPQACTLAQETLAAAPSCPLYARVDMVRGADGDFRLMELEIIEPALFLQMAADKGHAFAKAVNDVLTA